MKTFKVIFTIRVDQDSDEMTESLIVEAKNEDEAWTAAVEIIGKEFGRYFEMEIDSVRVG